MDFENCQPEERKQTAWCAVRIAWLDGETFTPQLHPQHIATRLLMWNGSEVQWFNPCLEANAGASSWTGREC